MRCRRCIRPVVAPPLAVAILLLCGSVRSDIKQIRPVDIKGGLSSGKVHMIIAPEFSGDSTKPFDGNQYTEMAILHSKTMSLTLVFDSLVRVEKTKVFFWMGGAWKLETADSVADLDAQAGTYALLVESNSHAAFAWDSASFAPRSIRCIRLSATNPTDSTVLLGEWTLEGSVTFTSFVLLPYPPRLLPGTNLPLRVMVKDDQGKIYPNFLTEPLDWRTADLAVARVDYNGILNGVALGTTTVTVQTDQQTLAGSAPVIVEQDFQGEKVAPMDVKVALVIQDMPVPPNYERLHEEFHWRNPWSLASDVVRHFTEATDSVVRFQFVETVDATQLFTRMDGVFLTPSRYAQLLREPGWTTLKKESDSGHIAFDYREFVKFYQYDQKRNNGQIDEVWVFAAPYLGMYESQLMGPRAFWWNSPPIRDGTALTKLLSVMGLNYERGVDQAFHSFGHRFESAMVQAYEEAQGKPWNPNSPAPTPWDLFTRINKDSPGKAHVGNIHFPPNGASDYNYGNSTLVTSYAQNWYRYPYVLDQTAQVNVSTWYFSPGDPLAEGLDHLGYLRWWYGHAPRYAGVTEGVLNNWWHYFLDYEAAVDLAGSTPVVGMMRGVPLPGEFRLEQNFPNPFNPTTVIRYALPTASLVNLTVYDLLGREIRSLVAQQQAPGTYSFRFDGAGLASGVYFYRLSTVAGTLTRKMLLLR